MKKERKEKRMVFFAKIYVKQAIAAASQDPLHVLSMFTANRPKDYPSGPTTSLEQIHGEGVICGAGLVGWFAF